MRSSKLSLLMLLSTSLALPAVAQQASEPIQPPQTAPSPAVTPSQANSAATTQTGRGTIEVTGDKQWTDSGIDLRVGDKVTVSAEGEILFQSRLNASPEGRPRGWRDLVRALPVNDAGNGALIGRITDSPAAVPFLIGAQKDFTARTAGRLYLGINQLASETSSGTYKVALTVAAAESTSTMATATTTFPNVTTELLAQIPRRVNDGRGNLGDMVNFMILGSEEQVKQAFAGAGWVLVDKTKKEAVLNAALSSLQRRSYVELPMSELFLFERSQDFGYARAEPIRVVASRHHLRIWRAPADVDGHALWVGAATHDIGFDRDNRTGGVTHKIDPNIDDEREFLGSSLSESGLVAKLDHITPTDPVKEAHTATGGTWHSDGRVLLLILR